MTASNKDTIYIDIDEEITGIIDKVRSSPGKIVALVLPKRASVLQSIVNMKLLKRSADEAKKNLVLITSEAGLLPLAGAVGLHVAKTPQSKPLIPTPPQLDDNLEETIDETGASEFSPANAANRPVGELAGLTAAGVAADDMETLELDDDEEAALAASAPPAATDVPKKIKKDSKLAVPNFERFRLLLVVGILGLFLLVGGLFYALTVLPKAVIAVTTNASNVNVGLDLVLDTAAQKVNPESGAIPAKLASLQKNFTQQSPATGQKNTGDRATGRITLSVTCTKKPDPIEAGVGVSSNNLTFITSERVILNPAGVDQEGNFICAGKTDVRAQQGGAQYNLPSDTKFTVAGYPSASAVSENNFSGGTDNIVKVVSQADIDAAKQKITSTDSSVKSELRKQLQGDGLTAITATYVAGAAAFTNTANPGSVADTVTVTATISYSMFGVKSADLESLVRTDIKSQIDTKKQGILNAGLDEAIYKVGTASNTTAEVKFETTATVGPDVDANELKKQVAGKKGGDVKKLLQGNPGVTDVQIRLSPFFVTSVPKNLEKITITVAKPTPAPSNAN